MKTVLITGIYGNLGRAVGSKFLESGYHVEGIEKSDRGTSPLGTHDRLSVRYIDIMDEKETKDTIEEIQKTHKITCAVLLVGGFGMGSMEDTGIEQIQSMIDLNFKTAYHVIHALFPYWKETGGTVVFITSKPALEQGGSFATAYSLSKSMLIKLTEIVNEEGNSSNIRAHAIAPEIIDTALNREAMPEADHSKWVTPSGIADIISQLCSEESAITQPILRLYNK